MSAAGRAAEGGPAAAFRAALAALPPAGPHVAVAFSGGPDSTALLRLTRDWAAESARRVSALVVDHGLRPESAAEAGLAARRARSLGVDAAVLARQGGRPFSGLQEAAREARYALLLDWCRAHGAGELFIGHHRDDQAATVLMRLRRGSGLDGLAAMRPESRRGGVRLIRPLLGVARADLLALLGDAGAAWIEDPGNDSPEFERNRLDGWLAGLDEDGRLGRRLGRLARRAARAADALETMADDAFASLCADPSARPLALDAAGWRALPEETALRVLDRAIREVVGARPPLGRLEDAMARLENQRRVTVGGAVLSLERSALRVAAEARSPRGDQL